MDINELRNEINETDEKLVELFCKRMNISLEIAKYKKENNLPVLDKNRERELLAKVSDASPQELEVYTRALYTTIFNLSRSYQHKYMNKTASISSSIKEALENTSKQFPKRAVVACQGVSGAYSEQACEKIFDVPEIMFFNNFEGVFHAVRSGLCDYGILPLENSTAGSVNQVYDLMRKNKFYVVKSIRLKVDHSLLAKKGTSLSDIKEVYSHEQAVNQCSNFISENKIKANICANTAVAAKLVASSDRTDIEAIASAKCAELYGLTAIASDIQNYSNNYTRFICISKNLEIYPGASKTSFMMTIPHVPGSLYSVISRFYALGINLVKIESRPLPDRDFEFMFYFDIECSVYSDELISLINELENDITDFTYLGSYSEVM